MKVDLTAAQMSGSLNYKRKAYKRRNVWIITLPLGKVPPHDEVLINLKSLSR